MLHPELGGREQPPEAELALYDSLSQASKEYDPYTDSRGMSVGSGLRYLRSDNWGNNDFAP